MPDVRNGALDQAAVDAECRLASSPTGVLSRFGSWKSLATKRNQKTALDLFWVRIRVLSSGTRQLHSNEACPFWVHVRVPKTGTRFQTFAENTHKMVRKCGNDCMTTFRQRAWLTEPKHRTVVSLGRDATTRHSWRQPNHATKVLVLRPWDERAEQNEDF